MFEQYGLIIEDHKRYYKEDLEKRDYSLENCIPYKLVINDFLIQESAWSNLTQKLVVYLVKITNISIDELLSFKTKWSNADFFSTSKRTNFKKILDGLYLNCNNTAVHSCWLIQDLLEFFSINKKDVELIIRRRGNSEPKEVREFFIKNVIEQFKEYLMIEKSYSLESVSIIIENHFNHINRYLAKMSSSYPNFFLFDELIMFENYRVKFLEKYKLEFCITKPKNIIIIEKDLNLLKNFYKALKY